MLTKSHIRKIAIEELTWRGVKIWIQNNVAIKGRKFIGEKGQADLVGYVKTTGLFCGCEIKTKSDRLSDEQHKWLSDLERAGGLALIACEEDGRVTLLNYSTYLERSKK